LAQQHSQPNDYVYRSVTITAGGYVPRLIAHPTEPGLIYTRTDIGSVYRWEAQDHRWQPLTDFQTPADYNGTNPPAPERALINRDGDLYVTFDDLPGPNVIDYGRRFANYLGSGALLVKGHPPV
jgi:hypothetical protein